MERTPFTVPASSGKLSGWVAGHFVWHEAPGCLLAAMHRLVKG